MHVLIDVMCGGIVAYLRMCGHDAVYAADRDLEDDDELLAVATAEGRTILTRDVQLATRAEESILLESRDVEDQLEALAAAGVDLTPSDEPERCGACNGPLEAVDRTEPTPGYAPDPVDGPIWRCRDCGQHFWQGSHWDRVCETLSRVRDRTTV
ncbi:Mut7-C RNAse domain-containing protein [Natronobeatus ordinarius]|uniref:Mut7-C RNAse domain-containing protein n=1 Tax=Natronobeatus ordinarius TaxID=2963433 RepID=UPI0020CFB771|nr:Mut7-C RNAse domain-containing protein [Natronobeatus ordinarius]